MLGVGEDGRHSSIPTQWGLRRSRRRHKVRSVTTHRRLPRSTSSSLCRRCTLRVNSLTISAREGGRGEAIKAAGGGMLKQIHHRRGEQNPALCSPALCRLQRTREIPSRKLLERRGGRQVFTDYLLQLWRSGPLQYCLLETQSVFHLFQEGSPSREMSEVE